MLQTISPYELLCASKPKRPAAVTTEYDLFSLHQPDAQPQNPIVPQSIVPAEEAHMRSTASAPAQRTHYIGDIHTRHAKAIRLAPQNSAPL